MSEADGTAGMMPGRLLISAGLGLLAAFGMQIAVALGLAVVMGLHNKLIGVSDAQGWHVPPRFSLPLFIFVQQLTLLGFAWRRGKREGRGDRLRGLGLVPVQSWQLFVLFMMLTIPLVWVWDLPLLYWGFLTPASRVVPPTGAGTITDPAWVQPAISLLLSGLCAPIVEELYYRGWLWTGLRRHWSGAAVAVVTALLWLSMHFFESLTRPLFLVPIAVLLSLVRLRCGSTRATIALHTLNNLVATGIVLFAELWG